MGFEEFGRITFVPFTKVTDFVEYLKDGKLKGTKCKKCDKVYFPPKADCTDCNSSEVEWLEFSGNGKLQTYTIINAAPTGFEDQVPYTIGVIDLEEGGRLLAWFEKKDIGEDELQVGMNVMVVPKKLEDDRVIYEIKLK
ncbi:MAG: Zn-ribbon domain-containing OB-fold protein [Thermoplasmata archaeon]|nr:Zn-ribbon domain-containing OB-fold protein [Thermoplasmata archaeon]